MEKVASFIVEKRRLIMMVTLALTLAAALMIPKVNVNTDMTKYLPDDSSMKIGIDTMDEQFPGLDTIYTLRVMLTDLPEGEKKAVKTELESLPYVDTVTYKAGDDDYNRDNHTLYIINSLHDFGTAENRALESELKKQFSGRNMVYMQDNMSASSELPLYIIVLAVLMVMIIMFIMCASWLEPILFLTAIGAAILMNMGTNILMGTISEISHSIAAILQLALSMDYSIILINRYRQEQQLCPDKPAAMKKAIANALPSVAGSAVTTIVGLLALVFMNFKIGRDLGTVLAKGVFFSLIYVIILLPALILMFDKWIEKTAKKAPHLKLKVISGFSYRFRHIVVAGLAVLFIGSFIMQQNTKTAFTLSRIDPIADVFPITNTMLVLFNNGDEEEITRIANYLEESEHIKSVASASTTIDKRHSSASLADELMDMDIESDFDFDKSVLDILYYYRYKGGDTGDIPMGDLLRFIVDDVAHNKAFSDRIGDEVLDNLDLISTMSDKEGLLKPKTIDEIADVFGLELEDVSNLFVYYFGEKGGAAAGTMSLSEFSRFINSDILTDPDFADLLDDETRDMTDLLNTITDRNEILTPKNAADLADALDMDKGDIELVYMYYFGKQGVADDMKLTIPQFASLLTEQVLKDERFADALDDDTRENANTIAVFANPKRFDSEMNSDAAAGALGVEVSMAELLYAFYFSEDEGIETKTLKIPQFTAILEELLDNEQFDSAFDEERREQIDILLTFANESKFMSRYSSKSFAELFTMRTDIADFLYSFYAAAQGESGGSIGLSDFVRFLQRDIAGSSYFGDMLGGPEQKAQIAMLATFTDQKLLLNEYNAEQMAGFMISLGLDSGVIDMIYGGRPTMSLSDFIDTLAAMGEALPPEIAVQTAQLKGIKDAALSGYAFSPEEMSPIIGIDPAGLRPLYIYRATRYTGYRLPGATLYDITKFIATGMGDFGGDMLMQFNMLLEIMNSVKSGAAYTPSQLSMIMGMEPEMMNMLYAYEEIHTTKEQNWRVSLRTLVDFAIDELAPGEYGGSIDPDDLDGLIMARSLMEGTLSGGSYTPSELAKLLNSSELSPDMLRVIYAYQLSYSGDTAGWLLNLRDMTDFILDDLALDDNISGGFLDENIDDVKRLRRIITGALNGTVYSAEEMADTLELDDVKMARMLYLLRINRYGDNSGWSINLRDFIHFLSDDVLPDEDMSKHIDAGDKNKLTSAKRLVDAVMEDKSHSAGQAAELFAGMSDSASDEEIKLLYIYYYSQIDSDPDWTFSLYELFNYLLDDILPDPLFGEMFDSKTRANLIDSRADIDEAVEQLTGPEYSRMVISSTYPAESGETYAFIDGLISKFDDSLRGSYYLIGDSPMNLEMAKTFDDEMMFITMLTAVAIFIVVALTFRSVFTSAILVLIIQCGVYITISIIGLQGYSTYYLALLIVQCILMGATIDYGILFTSYYIEKRETLPMKEALAAAYEGSSHTIFTSGTILVLVTGVLGFLFENPTIGEICLTISRGAISAIVLIVFVLPGMLAAFDSQVLRRKNHVKSH